MFEPDRILLADDLLEWSAKGTELYAKIGTVAAVCDRR